MLDGYNPPSRDDQMQVITAPTDDYLYLKQIVKGFLSELLPFAITIDEVKYMFNKFNDLYDHMFGVVDDFSSADSQESGIRKSSKLLRQSSSSYYSLLAKSFSDMVSEIPEMLISLQQYFKERNMSKEASETSSIMKVFNLENILKLCSIVGIKSVSGVAWVKAAYHIMVAIKDFFESGWTAFGKYLELALDDFTSINFLTHKQE